MALPTTVSGKNELLLKRQRENVAIEKAATAHAIRLGAEDAPTSSGCFHRLWACAPMRAARVSTREETTPATQTIKTAATNSLLNRLVGSKKKDQSVQLDAALQSVAARVSELADREKLARARAVAASRAGKKEEALRELKKAKAVEKQLVAARMALATLEQQHDMLAETALHQELTTVLKSTTGVVKKKQKGLLESAEQAVDANQEMVDDVSDISQVFEGLAPVGDVDEDGLLEELREMVGEDVEAAAPVVAPVAAAVPSFPTAPTSAREQRASLLRGAEVSL